MREPIYAAGWQLETISNLSHLIVTDETLPQLRLRAGVDQLLSDLSKQGFIHFLTSSMSEKDVDLVLRRFNWEDRFRRVFCSDLNHEDKVSLLHPQSHRLMAAEMGFSDAEARDRLIAIGVQWQEPNTVPGLVFVDANIFSITDLRLLNSVTRALLEAGEGSFIHGFESLYNRAGPIMDSARDGERYMKHFPLPSGVNMELAYRETDQQHYVIVTNPTVTPVARPTTGGSFYDLTYPVS